MSALNIYVTHVLLRTVKHSVLYERLNLFTFLKMTDFQKSSFYDDSAAIIRSLTSREDRFSLDDSINECLKDLNQNNPDLLQTCKTINYLLSFRLHSVVQGDKVDVDHVVNTCNSLLVSLNDENKHCFKVLCAIYEKSFILLESEKRQSIFCSTMKNLEKNCKDYSTNSEDSLCVLRNLHMFDCLLNVCCNELDVKKYFVVPENIKNLLVKLAFQSSSAIACEVVITIIPKLVILEASNAVLIQLWKLIETLARISSERNEHFGKILTILCSLSDFYIGPTFNSMKYILEFEDTFWLLLKNGLISNDLLQRRQSLYMLKRAIDYFDKSELTFLDCKIFWWDVSCQKELLNIWENIFLLLEIMEEKQVHLITPAFSAINKVIDATKHPFINGKVLNSSWMLSIFQRVLSHDSNHIIKLGLKTFMKIDVCIYCEDVCSSFLEQVFKSLNDMFLFDNLENECSIVLIIAEWFISWSKCEHNISFFEDILTYFVEVKWGPIPLFHVANALSQIHRKPSWGKSSLNKLKYFITEALRTQSIFIRGAIQCRLFKSLTLLAKVDNLTLIDIADVICGFRSNECIKRGTKTWEVCESWLKSFAKTDKINEFLECCNGILFNSESENSISPLAMARMLVLLYDSNLILCNNENLELFEKMHECFNECGKRLYSCSTTQDSCVRLFGYMIQEYIGIKDTLSITEGKFYRVLSSYLHNVMELLKFRLLTTTFSTDMDSVLLYISVLNAIALNKNFLDIVLEDIHSIQQISCKILTNLNDNVVQQFFCLKINCWILKKLSVYLPGFGKVSLMTEVMYRNIIVKLISANDFNKFLTHASLINTSYVVQKSVNKVVSGAICSLWKLFELYLSYCHPNIDEIFNKLSLHQLLQSGIEAMSTGGREGVVSVLRVFRSFFQYWKLSGEPLTYELISHGWDTCFELRKTELFWPAIETWVSMVYQKPLIEIEEYKSTLLNYAEKLVLKGNEVCGLLKILIMQLQSLSYTTDLTFLIDIIIEGIIFGPLPRKDEKFEIETCRYIESLSDACSVNYLLPSDGIRSDVEVRLRALDIVLISSTNDAMSNFLEAVIRGLIKRCNEMVKNNKRYFNDSQHHRMKHRIFQALLILESLLAESKNVNKVLIMEMFRWTVESLMGESQQPSVRYQLEWLFTRMLMHYIELQEKFWIIFDKAAAERIGSICSFISIAYHLAKLLNSDSFIEQCVENILPWCMAQNFNVRLYAQTVLQQLWHINGAISEKYSVIRKSQSKVCDQGNAIINLKKMQSDFYFKAFHPTEHFTLQVIYWDLPRLSNIANEELIPLSVVKKCLTQNLDFVPFGNLKNELTEYESASWICKGPDKNNSEPEISGIQKKYVPWKGMFQSETKVEKKCGGLIVVASLIDKPPNLGGLARTCEVFSAAELVLGSLQYVQDKQFTSLSLTAEKHLSISEIKPYNLEKYLRDMKNLGYTIVGAEQTSDSISLSTFKFPNKSVLVLGNEREGIPVNLLPLIDNCIQIPQFGVIRSLNVHVTGAIFLWEYAKQHLQN